MFGLDLRLEDNMVPGNFSLQPMLVMTKLFRFYGIFLEATIISSYGIVSRHKDLHAENPTLVYMEEMSASLLAFN